MNQPPACAIAEPSGQPGERLLGQLAVVRAPEQVTDDVHMDHPGGDPGEDGTREIRFAAFVQPSGAAQRMHQVPAEIQQPGAFAGQLSRRHTMIILAHPAQRSGARRSV